MLALSLVLLSAPCARAASGLYLTWNDCALGASQSQNLVSLCDSDGGQNTLYCAFTLPQATDNVLGIEVVVDVQHSALTLPDWWHFDNSGCRAGSLNGSNADFTGETGCMDPWQGLAFGGVQDYSVGPPTHPNPNQARIKAVAAVVSSDAATLDGTHMYYGLKIVIDNVRTQPPGPCTGCRSAACLVLNSILVRRIPASPGGDIYLQTPGPANANWATWQATGADCAAVPVRNTTWGRLKSLYR